MSALTRAELTLADGRTLSYGSCGDPQGTPLLLLDGPGSRIVAHFAAAPAQSAGVHVVAPDRPGMGKSDPKPDRTFIDWVDDARELVDALSWARFAVLGVSGGGPFALATAWGLPQRVTRLGLLAAMAPLDLPDVTAGLGTAMKQSLFFARRAPFVLRRGLRKMAARAQRDPEWVATQTFKTRPEDAHVLSKAVHREIVVDGMAVMWKAVDANTHEFRLMTKPWGFSLEEVQTPTWLWYGGGDSVHPAGMGRAMEDLLANATGTYVPDVGSFAFITNLEPILRTLVGQVVDQAAVAEEAAATAMPDDPDAPEAPTEPDESAAVEAATGADGAGPADQSSSDEA